MNLLAEKEVRRALRAAWTESQPGTEFAHEEGGFVLRNDAGGWNVERWPRGALNEIIVPSHSNCKRGELRIVATFHTHPNVGADFQQEPSLTDIRAVRSDPDLNHPDYQGELVLAAAFIYFIRRSREVVSLGVTDELLGAA